MKVFGIGLQKSGTTTLGYCLRKLGLNHMSGHTTAAWYLRLKLHNRLRRVMDSYDSFDDEPWAHAYQLADKYYPDAKFILTVRSSPEVWVQSLLRHCDRIPFNEHRRFFLKYMMPRGHEQELIRHYQRHIAEAQAYFTSRPDKLLVICWEEGDSWDKLCSFLELPIPNASIIKANASLDRTYPQLTIWRVLKSVPRYYAKKALRRLSRV